MKLTKKKEIDEIDKLTKKSLKIMRIVLYVAIYVIDQYAMIAREESFCKNYKNQRARIEHDSVTRR